MKTKIYRQKRLIIVALLLAVFTAYGVLGNGQKQESDKNGQVASRQDADLAISALDKLEVKGRAPKTGYHRGQFSDGWGESGGCDIRNLILKRDMQKVQLDEDGCIVLSGQLDDPYTGEIINFTRGAGTSSKVQIDHVVALSDAWQKGAQRLSEIERYEFANDSLNLLAVDGPTNIKKGDGDAATWLPPNKSFRCRYVARQIAVKLTYLLWVGVAEKSAMERVLHSCPNQQLPIYEE